MLRQSLYDRFNSLVWREQAEGQQYRLGLRLRTGPCKNSDRQTPGSGTPCGMTSIFAAGTWKISWRNCEECWLITIRRSESSASSTMTRCWSGFGSRSTVCRVVTIGIRRFRSSSRMWLPAAPPKIPYSCCTHTRSTLVKLRNSAAPFVRRQLLFGQLESHPLGIAVFGLRIVHRQCKQAFGSVLVGDSITQVGGESGNTTLPRKIVSNDCDSARKREIDRRCRTASLT